MISEPGKYIEPFRKAGADSLTIHVEAVADPRPVLDGIRAMGALAGLALNPPTPLSAIEPYLAHCDLILVMSVMPGFGGQKFEDEALIKLRELSDRSDCDALLEVDGGIGLKTVGPCSEAGAELFVAGTAIFRTDDYASTIGRLRSAAQSTAAGRMEADRARQES
jgi:ribulose-phosphate 3-epimerase